MFPDIRLNDAVVADRRLQHQVAAWNWLHQSLTRDQLQGFQDRFRANPAEPPASSLYHRFRQEQWCRWLMDAGGCDLDTATHLAQRLIKRAVDWGELDTDWGEQTADWGERSAAEVDPFKYSAVAPQVTQGETV